MKEVPLTQGKFALVDDEDYERVSLYRWCAILCGRKGYKCWSAQTKINGKSVLMHRFVMNAPADRQVDHRNHDTLDNRRSSNLRLCTNGQNQANRPLSKRNTTGYRGVTLDRTVVTNQWRAMIRVNRQRRSLGNFANKLDAAKAYDAAAIAHFGEFVTLNFPRRDAETTT